MTTRSPPRMTLFTTWQTPVYQGDLAAMAGPDHGPQTVTAMNARPKLLATRPPSHMR
ncbi:MAG: hypothetical protein QOI83_516 [Streptomycetaceae bacterium]|nr:hypothetical protein [Streptomycetaceae bacterium]